MFQLDVMLKFWELIFALVTVGLMVVGGIFVFARVRRRKNPPGFYTEAGGVSLTIGEERLLEALARGEAQQRTLAAVAKTLGADEIAVYLVARMLMDKDLVTEDPNLEGGSPRFDLSPAGDAAALARNYIKLI
jgi:hypothetical protein